MCMCVCVFVLCCGRCIGTSPRHLSSATRWTLKWMMCCELRFFSTILDLFSVAVLIDCRFVCVCLCVCLFCLFIDYREWFACVRKQAQTIRYVFFKKSTKKFIFIHKSFFFLDFCWKTHTLSSHWKYDTVQEIHSSCCWRVSAASRRTHRHACQQRGFFVLCFVFLCFCHFTLCFLFLLGDVSHYATGNPSTQVSVLIISVLFLFRTCIHESLRGGCVCLCMCLYNNNCLGCCWSNAAHNAKFVSVTNSERIYKLSF